jgi:hypothetical protein
VVLAVQNAFVDSLHNTFALAAVACLVGVGAAFLLHNPVPVQPVAAPARQPVQEEQETELLVVAD